MELTLVGVHLAYDARQASVKEPKTLIASHGGRLVMRRCSVTVLDDGSHQTAAVSLFGPEAGQALLDRVIVRGNGVTALAIDHHAVDVTAADCLFATGNAPLITIHGDGSGERDLRFFSCTMISDAMGIDARPNADSPSPPKTSILTSRCLITTPATGEGTVLLSVAGWPLRKSTTSTAGTAKGLTWQIDSSILEINSPTHYLSARRLAQRTFSGRHGFHSTRHRRNSHPRSATSLCRVDETGEPDRRAIRPVAICFCMG
jgi:hypothetical protein